MKYLGCERVVTLPFVEHQIAEDYAGYFASPISLKGSYRVIRVVNHFQNYEDTISYQTFLKNQNHWKQNDGYFCTTLSGKSKFLKKEELQGNCLILEGYFEGKKYQIGLYHLGSIKVKLGEIIKEEKILATQGNTGVVLSSKPFQEQSYGTHVHMEVISEDGNYLDPRPFATGEKLLSYEKDRKEDTLFPLFTCPRDGIYYLTLKEGEQLYLQKPEGK